MKMKYLFCLNVEKDEKGIPVGFFGYAEDHALQAVHVGNVEADNDEVACEILFEKFNIHHPADYRNRSMSVGDLVILKRLDVLVAYAVRSVGFSIVDLPTMAQLMS